MGTVVDTTVFIDVERFGRGRFDVDVGSAIGQRLVACLGPDEEAAIAAITASELLHGVHHASVEYRPRREAFVETILSTVPVLDFDHLAARSHARLWARLAATGAGVGAHDRMVAATAISIGWRVAMANVRHFDRVPGLDVVEVC